MPKVNRTSIRLCGACKKWMSINVYVDDQADYETSCEHCGDVTLNRVKKEPRKKAATKTKAKEANNEAGK